mgnify:CR=1 FL=1
MPEAMRRFGAIRIHSATYQGQGKIEATVYELRTDAGGLELEQTWKPAADTVVFHHGRYFAVVHWEGADRASVTAFVRELRKLVAFLSAGEQGRVTLEDLKKLFATALAEEAGDFASEEQFHFALQNGLTATVNRLIDSIIRRSLAENSGTKAKTLGELRISTRLLYASLKRSQGVATGKENEQ